jgi:hypothetical protein
MVNRRIPFAFLIDALSFEMSVESSGNVEKDWS